MPITYEITPKGSAENLAGLNPDAAAVLEYYQEEGSGMVTEVAHALSMPTSQVQGLMRGMLKEKWIEEREEIESVYHHHEDGRRPPDYAEKGQSALDKLRHMLGG